MESRIRHLTFVTTVLGNGADTSRSMELSGQTAKPNLETSKSMRNPLLKQKVERETLSQKNKVEILFQRVRWRTREGTWTTHTLTLTHTMEIIHRLSFILSFYIAFLFIFGICYRFHGFSSAQWEQTHFKCSLDTWLTWLEWPASLICPKLTVLCPRNLSSPIRRKPQGERSLWVGDKSSPPPQYGSHCFGLREGLVPFMFLAQKPLFQSHRIPFDKRESLIWKGLAKTKWGLNKGQDPGNLLHLPRSSPWGLPWVLK